MARRRSDEKKPDLGFEVPEFDEDDYIRKETISFRTTLILFLYSIITALVTFLVWAYVSDSWWLALFIGLGLGVALRWIYPALKVDVDHFGRKEWTGTGFLYFFSWLAFIIFLTNPPLYDGVEPTIEVHVTPDLQEPGSPINITLLAFDNVAIDPDTLQFSVTRDGVPLATTDDLHVRAHQGVWSWAFTPTQGDLGTYTVTAIVADSGSGLLSQGVHTTTVDQTFEVREDAIDVRGAGRTLASGRDAITVQVPDAIDAYRVWLEPADDPEADDPANTSNAMIGRVLLTLDSDQDVEGEAVWFAEPGFDGFGQGTNRFRVHVAEHDSYWLGERYDIQHVEAELVTNDVFEVTIEDADLLGDKTAKLPGKRATSPQQTPGFDVSLALVGLVGAVAVVARGRRDA